MFIRESTNRFLCEVKLENGEHNECYVPSSCRLSNFANFNGCPVLLNANSTPKTRTRFALYAIKYHRRFILVNLKEANRVIAENLTKRRFSFLGKRHIIKREYTIGNYKSDFFITDTNSVIEIKSVISLSKKQPLPLVFSDRALQQLRSISELLKKGVHVYYFFVAMNPSTECLCIEDESSKFTQLLLDNISKGMICKAYSLRIKNQIAVLNREIDLVLPSE